MAEAVVAIFILVSAFLIAVAGFDAALSRSVRVQGQAEAVRIAQERLQEIRGAATSIGGFRGLDGTFSGTRQVGDYQIETLISGHIIDSPSAGLESVFGSPRRMSSSAKKAEVLVTWGRGRSYRLTTVIGSPAWSLDRLDVYTNTPIPNPMVYLMNFDFYVRAWAGSEQVPDLMYRWYVVPITGNVTLASQNRSGSQATFEHSNEYDVFVECQLMVRTVYRGNEFSAFSPVLELADTEYFSF